MKERKEKKTHLPAETTRRRAERRIDDVAPGSPSVATLAGPAGGGMPFSLRRVSTTGRAASPCRLVFQLLKHPMHVHAISNVAAGQTHRLFFSFFSSSSSSCSLLLSLSKTGESRAHCSVSSFLPSFLSNTFNQPFRRVSYHPPSSFFSSQLFIYIQLWKSSLSS